MASTEAKPPRASCTRLAAHSLTFVGPAWLIAAAYIDPGSVVSDFTQGAYTGYQLLWLTLLATLVGCMYQNLSLRVGLATGKNLAKLCAEYYVNAKVNWTVWLLMEISTIFVDVQAVVGSALAISSLTTVPFWASCVIVSVLTLVLVLAYQVSGHKTELATAVLVIALILCFVGTAGTMAPPASAVVLGMVEPTAQPYTLFTALGIVGALVMPNVIFLHSDLVTQHVFAPGASKTAMYWASFCEVRRAAACAAQRRVGGTRALPLRYL